MSECCRLSPLGNVGLAALEAQVSDVTAEASGVSIYEHVRAHLPAEGPGLPPGGDILPDDSTGEEHIRWASGLIDHISDPGTELESQQAAVSLLEPFVEAAGTSPAKGQTADACK